MVLAVGSHDKLAFAPGTDAVFPHQTTYPFLTHAVTSCHKFFLHFWPTVFTFDLCVDGADVGQQSFVAHALEGARLAGFPQAFTPSMLKVAAGADAQYVAGQRDGPMGFVTGYPGVLHRDSRAKYAVAFFRMSRSIFTRASSALSRANSICSGFTGLSPAPLSSPLALSLTQFSKLALGMPSILAVTDAACPPLTSLVKHYAGGLHQLR
jgi:hypothetical protein